VENAFRLRNSRSLRNNWSVNTFAKRAENHSARFLYPKKFKPQKHD
jgi:hypothetical protein